MSRGRNRPVIPSLFGVSNFGPPLTKIRSSIQRITGEVGGYTEFPEIRNLTFSATPTKAELEALNKYMNEWFKALQGTVDRIEGKERDESGGS